MKPFSTLVVLRAPPETLFTTMRDRLPELAASLDDVDAIDEIERREEEGGTLLVVNRWHARQAIPGFLQAKLGASSIDWLDRASWHTDDLTCRWNIEPSLGNGAITCLGTTTFIPAMGGRGTRAQFDGRLDIAPDYLASLVGGLQTPVKALVESIATSLIPANFRAVAEAAAKQA